MNTLLKLIGGLVVTAALAACGGGGGSAGTTVPSSGSGTSGGSTDTPTPPVTNVASIVVTRSGSNTSIPADGSTQAAVVVQALNTGSAAIAGTTLTLSVTGGGVLSAGQVVTDSNGRATVNVTANATDQNNRNLVVEASCSSCTASPANLSIPVQGATLSLNPASTISLQANGVEKLLELTVRGANSSVVQGASVSFVASDTGIVRVSAAVARTDSNGKASVKLAGLAQGNATVSVWVLGSLATVAVDVSSSDQGLSFATPLANTVVALGRSQVISINAPGATEVLLATSKGLLGNAAASQSVGVVNGVAHFSISSPESGIASLTARDNLGRNVSSSIVFSPESANKLNLTAPQTSVPKASNGTEPRVVLTVRALFQADGGVDQPVANVPVVFTMGTGPSGGERIEPNLVITNSFGVATVAFVAGTEATNSPISVSAEIPGSSPRVATGLGSSSNSLAMNIGGGALSVAFGPSTKVQSIASDTLYVMPYSVVVTDSSNNPVVGKAVTLSMRPFAFSTGSSCVVSQTFCSEDINRNGSLEKDEEDGYRRGLVNEETLFGINSCPITANPALITGDANNSLTPQNSDAGVVPSTVITDKDGVATFNLTYLKQSAIWVVPLLKATVESNGTESSNFTIFRLRPSIEDLTEDGKCFLPASPYR